MHKPTTLSGNRARYQRLSAVAAPAVVAVLVAAAPRLAFALKYEVCLRWHVEAIDRTAGTLAETTALNWPARGTRVRVTHPNLVITVGNGRTNTTNGCFTFQSIFDTPGSPPDLLRSVRVFYDTRVGTPIGTGRIPVRGFFNAAQANAVPPAETSILIQNVRFTRFNDGVYRSTVNVGQGADPMSISMASVSHTLHRIDSAITMTDKKPATPPLLKVILANCQNSNTLNFSCTETELGKMWLTPDTENGSTTRKFVSGHETGHWLDFHWGGTVSSFASSGGDPDYTFASGQQSTLEPTCRFTWEDNGNGGQGTSAHAMRSQEHQTGAVSEGFAHFMALFAYNEATATSNPQFKYYKTQTPSDVDGSYPADDVYFGATPFTFPGFIATHFSFLDDPSGCKCTAHANCNGKSTEMQWMRAYWWYLLRDLTDVPAGPKPTLAEFFGQMDSAPKSNAVVESCHSDNNRCFGAVSSVLSGNANFLARWQSVGATMGLATDNP